MSNANKPTPLLPGGNWNRTYILGKVLGIKITAETSAIISGFVLWAILAVIGKEFLALTGPDVVVGGGLLVLLHYGLGFVHQFGSPLKCSSPATSCCETTTLFDRSTGVHHCLNRLLSNSRTVRSVELTRYVMFGSK